MAGATNINKAPYPNGPFHVRMGSYIPNGFTTLAVDTWIAPFDCKVREVRYTYVGGTADIDAVNLKTVDATAKQIVAAADMGNDIHGVVQTLHSDIVGFVIVAGNGIQLSCDTSGANEAGILIVDILVDPEYTTPQ